MPIPRRGPYDKGDLFLKLVIVMPQSQDLGSAENKAKLRSLLPKVPELPSNLGTENEEYVAKPHDEAAQAARQARERNSREHDDDEEGGGTRTAECRTQ